MTRKNSGFTLIELLVVVSIIAILSTLIVVYFNTAKMSARDSRRLSDVKQIQLALKMYYNDVGIYPTLITAGSSIANGGTNYLLRVPANPTPRSDNGCTDQEYQYKQLESGARYSLGFCLGDTTDDLNAGNHVATANGILNCPTGYVAIPGSSTFNTNDFCVMKYEAKCATTAAPTVGLTTPSVSNNTYTNTSQACTGSYAPVSVSSGYPIGKISQATAKTYCQNIGGHLLTNPEWMTIARNIEQVSGNWSTGNIGSGYINIGNYNKTNAMIGTPDYATGEVTWDYKRTHSLSSSDTIYDIAGNVSEWLDTTCIGGTGAGKYDTTSGYLEWSNGALDDYERGAAGPSSNSYTSSHKIGEYHGCTTDGNAFQRGGSVLSTSILDGGIFGLLLDRATTVDTQHVIGFRCVK